MKPERFRVLLQLKNLAVLKDLTIDSGCMPQRQREDGTIEIVAVVSREVLKKLRRKRSISVEVLADAQAEAEEAAKHVSRTNRYADGSLPVALGLQESRRVD